MLASGIVGEKCTYDAPACKKGQKIPFFIQKGPKSGKKLKTGKIDPKKLEKGKGLSHTNTQGKGGVEKR